MCVPYSLPRRLAGQQPWRLVALLWPLCAMLAVAMPPSWIAAPSLAQQDQPSPSPSTTHTQQRVPVSVACLPLFDDLVPRRGRFSQLLKYEVTKEAKRKAAASGTTIGRIDVSTLAAQDEELQGAAAAGGRSGAGPGGRWACGRGQGEAGLMGRGEGRGSGAVWHAGCVRIKVVHRVGWWR